MNGFVTLKFKTSSSFHHMDPLNTRLVVNTRIDNNL